jgi:hypothetical protein
MTSKLRSMIVAVGVFVLGGVAFVVATPQPATRTMAELRDAGILDCQPIVIEGPERLTPQAKRRINDNQPGLLRPRQVYAHIARTARCCTPDGGNCIRANDGVVRVGDLDGEIVIPSLRQNLSGVDLDASVLDVGDGGDSDAVDDSLQYARRDFEAYGCTQYDDLIDAGQRPNPFSNRYCNALNRVSLVPSPCMLPNCYTRPDGGWNDDAVVDCLATGPYGQMDGGPRWRGCNVTPRDYTTGAACLPVECSVVAGDRPEDWL